MDELERFKRDINLAELAAGEGFELVRRESSRASLVMKHPDGDKIVIATGEDGHGVFFSVHQPASGSVIDFVMHRRGLTLGHARKALRDWTGQPAGAKARSPIPKPEPIPHDRAALVATWHRLNPYDGGYLESRGLIPATIAAAADRIRQDERGNVAFRHDDLSGLTGWEIKNKGFSGFTGGGRKALFGFRVGLQPREAAPRLAVTESALDALSLYQADPAPGLYLSFAGKLSPEQHELLQNLLIRTPAAEVLAATDNDDEGEAFATLIQTYRPDARRARSPRGKDWNDAIRPQEARRAMKADPTATTLPPKP